MFIKTIFECPFYQSVSGVSIIISENGIWLFKRGKKNKKSRERFTLRGFYSLFTREKRGEKLVYFGAIFLMRDAAQSIPNPNRTIVVGSGTGDSPGVSFFSIVVNVKENPVFIK